MEGEGGVMEGKGGGVLWRGGGVNGGVWGRCTCCSGALASSISIRLGETASASAGTKSDARHTPTAACITSCLASSMAEVWEVGGGVGVGCGGSGWGVGGLGARGGVSYLPWRLTTYWSHRRLLGLRGL